MEQDINTKRCSKEYSIGDIQEQLLLIIKDIDKFCVKNNISYYLMGGSALGAMRHNGFIPWDDDLDIFMTVDQYEKFLKLFSEYGDKDKYFLQIGNTKEWPLLMSRVCLNGTTLISDEFKNNLKQHHAVFVDIMCLYSAPNSKFKQKAQFYKAQMLRLSALNRMKFKPKSFAKRLAIFISRIFANKLTRPLLINSIKKYENKQTHYVGHFFGRARFGNAIFQRKFIGSQRYVQFEDTKLPVFEHVEDYLEMRFGKSWKENPSQEVKDSYPIHGNFIDLEHDYTNYIDKETGKWII